MINLIPKEERKKMTIDFYCRLGTIFLMTINFSILIAIVTILPVYFISSVKNNTTSMKLVAQKNEPLPLLDQQTVELIKEVNSKLDLVEGANKDKFLVSEKVINAILVEKKPEIKITQIGYTLDLTQGKIITLEGVAPSREFLLSFRQALENSPVFKKVDLPISNFVKGSDIKFYLNLIPA